MKALLAALLVCSPAYAEEPLAARAVAFEATPVLVQSLGPLRLSLDLAGTRPLDGSSAHAGRLVLALLVGDWTAYASTQAQPHTDPEAQAELGLRWGAWSAACVVPELEADPWQEPPAPVAVVSWRIAL